MARTKITAEESPVGDIFTDHYRFEVPPYQRPYAWTTEQAGEMFEDLVAAATAPGLACGSAQPTRASSRR